MPAARTPVTRRQLSREHLSAISMAGELYWPVPERPYRSADVIGFLQQLLAAIPGKLPLIWDGANIHRSRAVKEYLSPGGGAAALAGTAAGLCAGAEPGRRGLALFEACGGAESSLR